LQSARHCEAKNEIRTIRMRTKRQGNDPREETHCLFWVGGRVVGDDGESRESKGRRDSGAKREIARCLTINPLSHQFPAKSRHRSLIIPFSNGNDRTFDIYDSVRTFTPKLFYRLRTRGVRGVSSLNALHVCVGKHLINLRYNCHLRQITTTTLYFNLPYIKVIIPST
jgi:hypothetical protein